MEDDPICGCDRKTHSNDCLANAKGVNIWHAGRCEDGNQCSPSINPCTILESYYCKMPEGMCYNMCGQPLPTQRGICTNYGSDEIFCTADWSPVCGCDGKVHSNTCDAHTKGVNASYQLDPNDDTVQPRGDCEIKEQTTEGKQRR